MKGLGVNMLHQLNGIHEENKTKTSASDSL